jgi:TolB-like protein
MTEDLITDLSKISGLFVIARNSSFVYKGKPVKVQEIGRDLGVRVVGCGLGSMECALGPGDAAMGTSSKTCL